MRRVGRPFQRPGKSGWWIRWTEPGGKRIHKNFHRREYADAFWAVLYQRLNSDVPMGLISLPLPDVVAEYLDTYRTRGLSGAAATEAAMTLRGLIDAAGPVQTKLLRQQHLDAFIRSRLACRSAWTVNKDVSNLRAFLAWARGQHYIGDGLVVVKVKTPPVMPRCLTTEQIRALLAACPTAAWRLRILLGLCTGVRTSDIDRLPRKAVDLFSWSLATQSRKTGKVFVGRPLPDALLPILTAYLEALPADQTRLFADPNVRKTWDAIRAKAGLPDVTRQDFRRTFATLMQRIGSIGSAQALLEHADARTTQTFYTDQELLLRWKVNQLPIREWLT